MVMFGLLAAVFVAGGAVGWLAGSTAHTSSLAEDQARNIQRMEAALDQLTEQTATAIKAQEKVPAAVAAAVAKASSDDAVDKKVDLLGQQQQFQSGLLMRLVAAEDAKYQRTLHQGLALQKNGRHAEAVAVFTVNIDNRPELFNAYLLRGVSRMELEHWEDAIADLIIARALAPRSPDPCNNLAWIRATCPVEEFRDGAAAVELATAACQLTDWSDPACLSTLAAAHAEQGDFEEALKRQKECVELAVGDAAVEFRKALELYENNQPYRTQRKEQPSATVEDVQP